MPRLQPPALTAEICRLSEKYADGKIILTAKIKLLFCFTKKTHIPIFFYADKIIFLSHKSNSTSAHLLLGLIAPKINFSIQIKQLNYSFQINTDYQAV
ncbi:hypothetical protein [Neisseria dentiae]|uniref:hypothetical protein n=1 Tax=Neisseria dentiae TaxID=194197 RepID=UPI0035A06C55